MNLLTTLVKTFSVCSAVCLLLITSLDARDTRVRRSLGSVCQDMWRADARNNLILARDFNVDTSGNARNLLSLTASGQTKLRRSVYYRFKALLDNYSYSKATQHQTAAYKDKEENDFINTIAFSNGPVDVAYRYLKANGKTTAKDLNAFKRILKTMWFKKYPKRGSSAKYSGFEHTFVGELGYSYGKRVVKGLHSWYQFHREQTAGTLFHLPHPDTMFYKRKTLSLVKAKYTWKGVSKPPGSSFYVGTSPAFEVALYTACFFGEPGYCSCSINGQQLKIKTINFRNAGMVLTSYPLQ